MTKLSMIGSVLVAAVTMAQLAGCATDDGGDVDDSGDVFADDGKADGPGQSTEERRAIMRAIHGAVDPSLRGQQNRYLVSSYELGEGFAFVAATIQAADGGELDWSATDYATAQQEGYFDGPSLTAVVHKGVDGYRVLEWAVGATDVSWSDAWNRYGAPCAIFPIDADVCAESWERPAVYAAVHASLDPTLGGQASAFELTWYRAEDEFVFLTANVAGVGGELDWSATDYATAQQEGYFDGPTLTVVLKKAETGYQVLELALGATDVSWWAAWERYGAPCAIFPIDPSACAAQN